MIAASFRFPSDAYQWALGMIARKGSQVRTEDGQMTKELCNLCISIKRPLEGWPIAGSGWNMEGLKKYAEQLLSGENDTDFAYTYGERLRHYYHGEHPKENRHIYIDQIESCINRLKNNKESRRAVAITWYPGRDRWMDEVPCLQLLDFLIRDGKLHCTAVFRSQDIARAWPCNVYGIGRLMQHIADEVGVSVGSLTTISASAHVYED